MKEYAREDDSEASDSEILFRAQLMIHDFGMRASSVSEESEVLGKAHLLVYPGTDTFSAAYQAWMQNGEKRVGSSILALAHRTVQGSKTQRDSFQKIRKAAGLAGIASYVSDCYDFHNTIDEDIVPMAIEASKTDKAILVPRPDSGDYKENVMYIVSSAKENSLYALQKNGRYAMNHMRFIQGDSMNWNKIKTVMETLKDNNYSPVNCGIFGVGGWLRNTPNRDTLSVAYKLMAKGEELEPVIKLSDTRVKMSVPGPVKILRGQEIDQPSVIIHYETEFNGDNKLQVFYDGSAKGFYKFKEPCLESFETLQKRVIYEFDSSPRKRRVLSDEIIRLQNKTMEAHGRTIDDYMF